MVEKLLLVFQQSELDAVKMYQVLTDKAGSEDEKQLLRRLGAVEGRHAAILRGITGVTDLKPTDKMAAPVALLREKLGKNVTYTLLALGEHGAYYLYQPLAHRYDALRQVALDERNHGKTLLKLVGALRRSLPVPAMVQ